MRLPLRLALTDRFQCALTAGAISWSRAAAQQRPCCETVALVDGMSADEAAALPEIDTGPVCFRITAALSSAELGPSTLLGDTAGFMSGPTPPPGADRAGGVSDTG